MSENPLIGRTIECIDLADDKEAIRFTFGDGSTLVANCDADCCSSTWIENVENPEAAIGSPVLVAEYLEMPDLGNMKGDEREYECIQYYGFKIETIKGTCTIDYRNSSNGYYGGSLVFPPDTIYGGVFNQNVSHEFWKHVAGRKSPE